MKRARSPGPQRRMPSLGWSWATEWRFLPRRHAEPRFGAKHLQPLAPGNDASPDLSPSGSRGDRFCISLPQSPLRVTLRGIKCLIINTKVINIFSRLPQSLPAGDSEDGVVSGVIQSLAPARRRICIQRLVQGYYSEIQTLRPETGLRVTAWVFFRLPPYLRQRPARRGAPSGVRDPQSPLRVTLRGTKV